jgi:hypothetical protein
LSANPIARAAVARERIRRIEARKEQLEVFKRIFAASPGSHVRVPVARRILRVCGLKLSRAQCLDVMMEAFPSVVYGKDPTSKHRSFNGVRVRAGMSAADIGDYLRRKFDRNVGGAASSHKKPAEQLDGVVAEYEAILESEGLPADVNDVKDPVGRSYRELPGTDPEDDNEGEGVGSYTMLTGKPADGWGRKGPLAWWPKKARMEDPSIGPDIAAVRHGLAELAYRLPNFFPVRTPAIETMWRLVRLEGMTCPVVAKIVNKTPNAVKLSVLNTEKRLMKHLKALGETNVQRLFEIDRPLGFRGRYNAIRYLYETTWPNETERTIWEKVSIEKADPRQAARELGLDERETARIVRRHRIRAGLPIDAL